MMEIKDDSVPETKPVPGAQYKGCFEDHNDRILEGAEDNDTQHTIPQNTIQDNTVICYTDLQIDERKLAINCWCIRVL